MFVLRNNLLITINRDTISFLALSSPREFQTSLVLSCYSSTAGRTAVKGAIICFPPDSSHLSHPTDFLKNTYIHILTHLLFYCLLLYYLLSSQPHFQTHILLETYNLFVFISYFNGVCALCLPIFFLSKPAASVQFYYLYPCISFSFCHLPMFLFPLSNLTTKANSQSSSLIHTTVPTS